MGNACPFFFKRYITSVHILSVRCRHTYLQGRLGNVISTAVAMCSAKTPEEEEKGYW